MPSTKSPINRTPPHFSPRAAFSRASRDDVMRRYENSLSNSPSPRSPSTPTSPPRMMSPAASSPPDRSPRSGEYHEIGQKSPNQQTATLSSESAIVFLVVVFAGTNGPKILTDPQQLMGMLGCYGPDVSAYYVVQLLAGAAVSVWLRAAAAGCLYRWLPDALCAATVPRWLIRLLASSLFAWSFFTASLHWTERHNPLLITPAGQHMYGDLGSAAWSVFWSLLTADVPVCWLYTPAGSWLLLGLLLSSVGVHSFGLAVSLSLMQPATRANVVTCLLEPDYMTRQHRRELLQQVFTEFDLDGMGTIGEEEFLYLGEMRRTLGQKDLPWTEQRNRDFMARVGIDSERQVRHDTFIAYFDTNLPADRQEFVVQFEQFMQCASVCRDSKIQSRRHTEGCRLYVGATLRLVRSTLRHLVEVEWLGFVCLAVLAGVFGHGLYCSESEPILGAAESTGVAPQVIRCERFSGRNLVGDAAGSSPVLSWSPAGWVIAAVAAAAGGLTCTYIKCRICWWLKLHLSADWVRGLQAIIILSVLVVLGASACLRCTDNGNSFLQGAFETSSKSVGATVATLFGQRVLHVDLSVAGSVVCVVLCYLRVVIHGMATAICV